MARAERARLLLSICCIASLILSAIALPAASVSSDVKGWDFEIVKTKRSINDTSSNGVMRWPLPPIERDLSTNPPVQMLYYYVIQGPEGTPYIMQPLLNFIQEFANEIKQKYGDGDTLIARTTGYDTFDAETARYWDLYFQGPRFRSPRLTAKIALLALDQYLKDTKKLGVAAIDANIGKDVGLFGADATLYMSFPKRLARRCPPSSNTAAPENLQSGQPEFYTCSDGSGTDSSPQVGPSSVSF